MKSDKVRCKLSVGFGNVQKSWFPKEVVDVLRNFGQRIGQSIHYCESSRVFRTGEEVDFPSRDECAEIYARGFPPALQELNDFAWKDGEVTTRNRDERTEERRKWAEDFEHLVRQWLWNFPKHIEDAIPMVAWVEEKNTQVEGTSVGGRSFLGKGSGGSVSGNEDNSIYQPDRSLLVVEGHGRYYVSFFAVFMTPASYF